MLREEVDTDTQLRQTKLSNMFHRQRLERDFKRFLINLRDCKEGDHMHKDKDILLSLITYIWCKERGDAADSINEIGSLMFQYRREPTIRGQIARALGDLIAELSDVSVMPDDTSHSPEAMPAIDTSVAHNFPVKLVQAECCIDSGDATVTRLSDCISGSADSGWYGSFARSRENRISSVSGMGPEQALQIGWQTEMLPDMTLSGY